MKLAATPLERPGMLKVARSILSSAAAHRAVPRHRGNRLAEICGWRKQPRVIRPDEMD
jgi:hypothetical protein